MHRSTRNRVAAVIALLVQAAVGNAQTTSPLDLLKEAAAPGERIPYGKGTLQFGELRVPDGPGVIQSPSWCMAAAGAPSWDNYQKQQRRWTCSAPSPLLSSKMELPFRSPSRCCKTLVISTV